MSFSFPLAISTGQVSDEIEFQITEEGSKYFVSAENLN